MRRLIISVVALGMLLLALVPSHLDAWTAYPNPFRDALTHRPPAVAPTNRFTPGALRPAAAFPAATAIYGQPDFTSTTPNNGGVSATSLSNPAGLAVDTNGNLYVADNQNSRVLYYPAGQTTATRVYGQPDFTSNTVDNGGTSAVSVGYPAGLALDDQGNLYVADPGGNRVLYYPAGQTTATRVYGQPDFTSNLPNNGGVSATSLNTPDGIAVDRNGTVYISDTGNNRLLSYPVGQTSATRVYGQPDFTSNLPNNGGVSATSLNGPVLPALDRSGNLYAADGGNARVLYYPAGQTTATRVYGQSNFTSNTPDNGGVSESSLNFPVGVTFDAVGNLYVSDNADARVLYYPAGQRIATGVYGQPDFNSNIPNNGGGECHEPR